MESDKTQNSSNQILVTQSSMPPIEAIENIAKRHHLKVLYDAVLNSAQRTAQIASAV